MYLFSQALSLYLNIYILFSDSMLNEFSPLIRPHCEKQNNQVKALKLYCGWAAAHKQRKNQNRRKTFVGYETQSAQEQSARRTAERECQVPSAKWYMVWYLGITFYGTNADPGAPNSETESVARESR